MPTTDRLYLPERVELHILAFFQQYAPATVSRYLRQAILQYLALYDPTDEDATPIHPQALMLFYDLFSLLDKIEDELA
jgi:hypothetical protein